VVPIPESKSGKGVGLAERLGRWIRSRSPWFVAYCSACGAIEVPPVLMAPVDGERYGWLPAPTPRQGDVLVIMGYVSRKTLRVLIRLYKQMPEPRYVIVGCNCPATGGLYWDSYATVKDVSKYLPVNVWVPGCMPRADDWMIGFRKLQQLIAEGKIVRPGKPIEKKPGELEELIVAELRAREERFRRERQ